VRLKNVSNTQIQLVTGRDFKKLALNEVKLSLCLTKHHPMKTYWESGGIVPRIL
jgi:hypothetical protein